MEVCGGQTHAIVRNGIDQLLPDNLELLHGPGCPVCVTPLELVDKAISIAARSDVIFTSFGDMLRVPGSSRDLFQAKSEGADVRVIYSPLDALQMARENPDREVVFFAVGFETTVPSNAMAVWQAKREGLRNFSVLVSHVLVPPALVALLKSTQNRVQGFLAAGHVCTVAGWSDYTPIAEEYKVPIVVTGFEPVDILQGILSAVEQLESGQARVENQYTRAVLKEGNPAARRLMDRVFVRTDRKWRGIGLIPDSGLKLSPEFNEFDAESRFQTHEIGSDESSQCMSGLVLQGLKKPHQCPEFGNPCTPQNPLGATMVSSEGACAAYFRYSRIRD
jgi:hydrogenase expression/formation protein HypD